MEDTLNHLKILNVLSPRGFHIPNCDKKGFYKKKQVSSLLIVSVNALHLFYIFAEGSRQQGALYIILQRN